MYPISDIDLREIIELCRLAENEGDKALNACAYIAERLSNIESQYAVLSQMPNLSVDLSDTDRFYIPETAVVLNANDQWFTCGWIKLTDTPAGLVSANENWLDQMAQFEHEILHRKTGQSRH